MGFEFNKWAGAFLFSALVVVAVTSLTGMLFHIERPESPAYPVAVADHGADHGAAEAASAGPDLPTLLAAAEPSKGERLFKQCTSCHNADKGGADGTGPNLWGIVGAEVGHRGDFAYSNSLLEVGGNWTFEKLDAFLENPKALARGTKMSFAGVRREGDRASLLVWLNQQSDSPQPLPTPSEAPAPADESGEPQDVTPETVAPGGH